jgi:hemolysin-activating ACP:hemolysin acyltransferase
MRRSFLRIYGEPAEEYRRSCEQFGYAALLMTLSASREEETFGHFRRTIVPAVYQKQIRFYFNEDGLPVGYVVWALLAEDVEQRVLSTGVFDLHDSEWNEGSSLWIVDLVAPLGNLKYVLLDLRDSLFKDHQRVRYLRTKKERTLAREIVRNTRRAFFRPPERQPSRDAAAGEIAVLP